MHIYCAHAPFLGDRSSFKCLPCSGDSGHNQAVDARIGKEGNVEFYYARTGWVNYAQPCTADLHNIIQYLLQRGQRGLHVYQKECVISGATASKTYFSNGTFTGITQYFDGLDSVSLKNLEDFVLKILEDGRAQKLLPRSFEETKQRTKAFFNYRYTYGSGHKHPELFNDVESINEHPLLVSLASYISRISGHDIDQITINYYHTHSSNLGVHMDSEEIFHLPVTSLRLFSERKLWFGCSGQGMSPQQNSWFISQPPGTITIMDGIAGTNFTHCVRPRETYERMPDTNPLSVSIMFRRVKKLVLPSVALTPNEFYEVESLVRKSRVNGIYYYLVKWKGWGPEHSTWKTFHSLQKDGLGDLVNRFECEHGNKKEAYYEVENIVDKRFDPESGTHEYLVKWKGWTDDHNTWEACGNLIDDGLYELVQNFEERFTPVDV